jgi:hypothetical protein
MEQSVYFFTAHTARASHNQAQQVGEWKHGGVPFHPAHSLCCLSAVALHILYLWSRSKIHCAPTIYVHTVLRASRKKAQAACKLAGSSTACAAGVRVALHANHHYLRGVCRHCVGGGGSTAGCSREHVLLMDQPPQRQDAAGGSGAAWGGACNDPAGHRHPGGASTAAPLALSSSNTASPPVFSSIAASAR